MLDLDFSAEQECCRETVRGVLAPEPATVVRELEDDPVGYPLATYKQLGELDLLGLLLPEEHGGAGMTLLKGVVLYEEWAHPGPAAALRQRGDGRWGCWPGR